MSGDALTSKAVRKLNRAQRLADDYLIGDDRYTELTLWDDGDFRITVFHGFPCPEDIHHGERVKYKHSDDDYIYEIIKKPFREPQKVLRSKVIT